MSAQELVLHIAVNLARISRWATAGNQTRIDQFLAETDDYLQQLEQTPKSERFVKTLAVFKQEYRRLNDIRLRG